MFTDFLSILMAQSSFFAKSINIAQGTAESVAAIKLEFPLESDIFLES